MEDIKKLKPWENGPDTGDMKPTWARMKEMADKINEIIEALGGKKK